MYRYILHRGLSLVFSAGDLNVNDHSLSFSWIYTVFVYLDFFGLKSDAPLFDNWFGGWSVVEWLVVSFICFKGVSCCPVLSRAFNWGKKLYCQVIIAYAFNKKVQRCLVHHGHFKNQTVLVPQLILSIKVSHRILA